MENKWMDIAVDIAELVKEKDAAYGSAVEKSEKYLQLLFPEGVKPEQYRHMILLVRDFDKNMRIAHRKDAFGESPWRDKLGYALLAVEMDERNQTTDDLPVEPVNCTNCGFYYKNARQDIEVQCCSGSGENVACNKWKQLEKRCSNCRRSSCYYHGKDKTGCFNWMGAE